MLCNPNSLFKQYYTSFMHAGEILIITSNGADDRIRLNVFTVSLVYIVMLFQKKLEKIFICYYYVLYFNNSRC